MNTDALTRPDSSPFDDSPSGGWPSSPAPSLPARPAPSVLRLSFLIGAGRLAEATAMCRRMLGQGPEGVEQARLRLCLCQLLREQGQREAAEQEADAAIWLLGLEDRAWAGLRAQALYEKGLLRWLAGDGAGATPLVRQALSRCRTLEAPPEVPELPALCTVLLARIARAGGRYDRAARQLREALQETLQETLPGALPGAQAGTRALLWQNLALVESERGRREVAVAAAEAAICEASRPEAAETGWRVEPLRELLVRILGG